MASLAGKSGNASHQRDLHGNSAEAVGVGDAEILGTVVAPAPDDSVARQCRAEIVTGGNARSIGQSADLYRGEGGIGRVVAELSEVIRPGRPHGPVGPHIEGVELTRSDCGDSIGDVLRIEHADVVAKPELTLVVVTPAVQISAAVQCKAVVSTSRDGHDVGRQALNLNRHRTVGRCPVSELAHGVVTPRPDASVVFQRKAVKAPTSNGDDPA